jgi:hypothetical protein
MVVFHYPGGTMTAYRISGGRVGFWESDNSSTWSAKSVSQAPLGAFTSSFNSMEYFGYAPADVARVVPRLADGREYSTPTITGWPGSGLRLWGSITRPAKFANPRGTTVITLDSAGHVIDQVLLSPSASIRTWGDERC